MAQPDSLSSKAAPFMPFCYWGALKCVPCDAFLLSLQPLTLHTGGCPRPVLLILPSLSCPQLLPQGHNLFHAPSPQVP